MPDLQLCNSATLQLCHFATLLMFLFLSKFLPLFIYPLGLSCTLLIAAMFLRKHRQWQTAILVITFLVIWLGGNRFVTMTVTQTLESQYQPPTNTPKADVIIVLGGMTRSRIAPRQIPEISEEGDRLFYAAWLYKHGAAPTILLSGGKPFLKAGNTSESDEMAQLLELMAIPKEALWLESFSDNTYENAVETKRILTEKGLNRILLVTSALHMPRAVAIFKKQGFDVIPAPTDYLVTDADWEHYTQADFSLQLYNLLPSSADLDLTSRAMKEWIGIIVYKFRGWL